MAKRKLTIGALILVLSAAFLSYFCKFAPDLQTTVDPSNEMSAPELQTKPNPEFASKLIASTSNIAMVLIHSDFSDENAVALDSLRSWAKERISEDPQYLHPATVRSEEAQNTVFSAFMSNLCGPGRFLMDDGIKDFLSWRIDEFHNSDEYQSFRIDYYGLFGVDPEAATLLVRYQEERAKLAVPAIFGFLFLVLTTVACLAYYLRSRQWMSRGRIALSYAWLAGSFFYLICAWYANEVSFMVSSVVSCLIGLYLRNPIALSFDEAGYLDIRAKDLGMKVTAVLAWISLTLVGIQILTWVRSGSLIQPDPVTLLISSVTGNFLHDPSSIKREVVHAVGLIWIIASMSTIYFMKRGLAATPELEAQLANLDHVNASR